MLRRTFLKSLPAWSLVFMPWLKAAYANPEPEKLLTKAAATGKSETKLTRLSDILKHEPTSDTVRQNLSADGCAAQCNCCGLTLPFGLFDNANSICSAWCPEGDRVAWYGYCPISHQMMPWSMLKLSTNMYMQQQQYSEATKPSLEQVIGYFVSEHMAQSMYRRPGFSELSYVLPDSYRVPLLGTGLYHFRWLCCPEGGTCFPLRDMYRCEHTQLYWNGAEFWGTVYSVRRRLFIIDTLHETMLRQIADYHKPLPTFTVKLDSRLGSADVLRIRDGENNEFAAEISYLDTAWVAQRGRNLSCQRYEWWRDAAKEEFTFSSYLAAEVKARSTSVTPTGLAALARLPSHS